LVALVLQNYELVGGITMKVEGPVSKPKSVTLKSTVVSVLHRFSVNVDKSVVDSDKLAITAVAHSGRLAVGSLFK
jgi:hypothetical protein